MGRKSGSLGCYYDYYVLFLFVVPITIIVILVLASITVISITTTIFLGVVLRTVSKLS